MPMLLNLLLLCSYIIESIRAKLSLSCHPHDIVRTPDFLHTFSQDSLMNFSCIVEQYKHLLTQRAETSQLTKKDIERFDKQI